MSNLRERVLRGAVLLDRKRPGWWKTIDLFALSMSDCSRCIVGQALGQFDELAFEEVLGLPYETAIATAHGFDKEYPRKHYGHPELREEWVALITERRAARSTVE